jgi:hypothetical protein
MRKGGWQSARRLKPTASIRTALPVPSFPDELPVSARREDIAAMLTAGRTSMNRHNIRPNICPYS